MLVVISDLHLTDGTSGETINDKAFRIFRNRVSDMAYDASWRDSDDDEEKASDYVPVDEINILLLGDILDMIRSEEWNHIEQDTDMPWTGQRQDVFFNTVSTIVDNILRHPVNSNSFRILKGIADGDIKIPKSMREATPEETAKEKIRFKASDEKVAPKVNIYYMVGNHDWFFYIDNDRMNAARNKVIDALGLTNTKDHPFPFFPSECPELQKIQNEHRVFAIHGDEFDETNYREPSRDGSSIGDVVVIRLLNQIPSRIYAKLVASIGDTPEVKNFYTQLREIDNLRPYGLAPAWITQAVKDTKLDTVKVNQAIGETLREVVTAFCENHLVEGNRMLEIEMKLTRLFFSSSFSIEVLSKVVAFFSLDKDKFESYQHFASKMAHGADGVNKDFFLMGHTHYPEIVPLSTYRDASGEKHNRIYFNTGTWRTLHKTGLDDNSFISYKTMTIAAFYKADERSGRPFEYWIGSLAL